MRLHLFAIVCLLLSYVADASSITDLSTWTLLQDPPQAGLTTLVTGTNSNRLSSNGAVPSGSDIGYASVNGPDVATSSAGYYFDPASSFSVAIDFALLTRSTTGAGGIGFGIGEDAAGADSAGVGLGIINGQPVAFSTAGRVADVDQPLQLFATAPTLDPPGGGSFLESAGRFFAEYNSITKDVILGLGTTPGAPTPTETKILAGFGAGWDTEPLLVSFFLRSQGVSIIPAFQSGLVRSIFSNFTVLSGTPITIPEPTSAALASLAFLAASFPRMGRFRV